MSAKESAQTASLDDHIETGFGTENKAIDHAFHVAETEAVRPKALSRHKATVCPAEEIPEGGKFIVQVGDISIGVFRIQGKFYALRNLCPHKGGPLCQGHIQTTHRPSDVHRFEPALEGRVIRCPWHGWEFDIVTGKGLYDRRGRAQTYPVHVNAEGDVVVSL